MECTQRLKYIFAAAIVGVLLGLVSTNINASGLQLNFVNASGLGNAYSGAAAIADDASTIYFNPAGMSLIDHQQFVIGINGGRFNGTYRGSDVFSIPPFVTIPQSGFVNGQPAYAPYPFIYYMRPVNDKIAFGLGVSVPQGFGTSIPDTSIIRYSGTETIIYVIDITPAVSYKINNQLSAGLGLDIQNMTLKTAVMFPSFTGGPDSRIINNASGWGYGWHGGLLYKINPCTRVGLTYHSQSVFHPQGQSEFVVVPKSDVGNEIVSNNFKFSTTLPPYTMLSVYRDINQQLAVMGTVSYEQWSFLNHIVLHNIAATTITGAPAQTNAEIQQYFRDTWHLAVGANYKINHCWMLRAGLGYETDPTVNQYRVITNSGTGSTSIAVGAHYQAFRTLGFDGGYMHFFMRSSSIHAVNGLNTENGTVQLQRDAAGLQATWDIV